MFRRAHLCDDIVEEQFIINLAYTRIWTLQFTRFLPGMLIPGDIVVVDPGSLLNHKGGEGPAGIAIGES